MKKLRKKEQLGVNISYPSMRQQWFLVCIFPLRQLFGLTGIENRRSQIARNPTMIRAYYVMRMLKKGKSVIVLNFKK